MSVLRQRMIEGMQIRNLAQHTQRAYLKYVPAQEIGSRPKSRYDQIVSAATNLIDLRSHTAVLHGFRLTSPGMRS